MTPPEQKKIKASMKFPDLIKEIIRLHSDNPDYCVESIISAFAYAGWVKLPNPEKQIEMTEAQSKPLEDILELL